MPQTHSVMSFSSSDMEIVVAYLEACVRLRAASVAASWAFRRPDGSHPYEDNQELEYQLQCARERRNAHYHAEAVRDLE